MKNIVIICVLVFTSSLFAQEKVEVNNAIPSKQSDELMTKIASDPDLRIKMVNLMIEETSGNSEEMMKLVNTMFLNPDMKKMMLAKSRESTDNDSFSIDARGSMKDPTKDENKSYAEPIKRKKNNFPK